MTTTTQRNHETIMQLFATNRSLRVYYQTKTATLVEHVRHDGHLLTIDHEANTVEIQAKGVDKAVQVDLNDANCWDLITATIASQIG